MLYRYKTSNGIERSETGTLEENNGSPFLKVKGKSQYIGSDKIIYLLEYTSDENGYKPKITKLSETQEIRSTTPPPMVIREPVITRIGSSAIASLTGGGIGK